MGIEKWFVGSASMVGVGIVVLLSPSLADAQSLPIAPGDRVRVSPSIGRPWTGSVQSVSADSLVLLRDPLGNRRALALASLNRLEVFDGPRSRDKALRVGALVGGAIGLVLGLDAKSADCGFICDDLTVGLPVAGALIGAGLGAVVGGGDRWKQVHPDAATANGLKAPGGVSVALKWRHNP